MNTQLGVISDLNILVQSHDSMCKRIAPFFSDIDVSYVERNNNHSSVYDAGFIYAHNLSGIWYQLWPKGHDYIDNPFFDIGNYSKTANACYKYIIVRENWKNRLRQILNFFIEHSGGSCLVFVYLGNETADESVHQMNLPVFMRKLMRGELFLISSILSTQFGVVKKRAAQVAQPAYKISIPRKHSATISETGYRQAGLSGVQKNGRRKSIT